MKSISDGKTAGDDPAVLSIGEVSRRTGIPVAGLRNWEQRYSLPRPERLPNGRRRYRESDCLLLDEVLRGRAQGLSLAAAMAHEIAHVAARHMTRQATKLQIAKLAAAPVGAALGGWTGYAASAGAGVGIPMTFLSFGRKDEAEADYLGVQYAYAAGYDPTGVISIFEKLESLERKQPGAVSRAFASHPQDADRISRTQREIQEILPAKADYVVTTSENRDIRKRLIDLRAARENTGGSGQPLPQAAPGGETPRQPGDSEDSPVLKRRDLLE